MPQKIFRQFGTVRDENLLDIDDLTLSLNNLLDKLVDEGSTYISEDLDCIRQISTTGLDNPGFLLFAQNEETVLSPLTKREIPFTPRKTYQNRLDIIKTFTGEPRFSGGNGPSAYYFNADAIDNNKLNGDFGEESLFSADKDTHENLSSAAIPGSVETGELENSSWTNGNFNYNGRIQDLMKGFGGIVQWEGYFIPTVTGVHVFRVYQTGLYHMDWQADDYTENQYGTKTSPSTSPTYVTAKRIGLENTVNVTVVDSSKVVLTTPSDKKFVGHQLMVSGTNITGDGVRVGEFSEETNQITFEGTPVSGAAGDTFNLTLKKELGVQEFVYFTTPVLQKYKRYKVKWRFIMPEFDANGDPISGVQKLPKIIEYDFDTPVSSMGNLRYNRLYSHDYNFTNAAKGTMVNFVDNSVLFGGGEIGRTKKTVNGDRYKTVETNKKIDIKYAPKENSAGIVKTTHTIDTVAGTSLITLSDTSGIEIGTRVFGDTVRFLDPDTNSLLPIDKGAEVVEIVINEGIFLSGNFETTVTNEKLTFIEHRGFVKRIMGDSAAGGVITLKGTAGGGAPIAGGSEDTTDLRDGMIVIGNDGTNGDFNKFTAITLPTDGSTNNVTVSSPKDMIYGIPITLGSDGSVLTGGTGYSNATNVATTVSPAGGTGLTVNITTVSNVVTKVVINTAGTGYNVGDTVTITGGDGTATFKITSVAPFFYFYQGKGLINDSLIPFCENSTTGETVCLTATATALAGATQISVKNDSSFEKIAANTWFVQGSAFSTGEGADLVSKSKITSVDITNFKITLDTPLVKNISKDANFTASDESDTRILCCPPTDTSPPFLATENGLETTTADPKLVLDKGNLVFDNLSAANVPTGAGGDISEISGNPDAEQSILIQTGVTGEVDDSGELLVNDGTTFKILCA